MFKTTKSFKTTVSEGDFGEKEMFTKAVCAKRNYLRTSFPEHQITEKNSRNGKRVTFTVCCKETLV